MEVHTIVTHWKPDIDEITAQWLLKKFGQKMFPGAENARVVFVEAGSQNYRGRTAEECEKDGILMIGVGGGRFDEHPNGGNSRKEDECAATLVAKALGVDENPALGRILQYVARSDLKGHTQPFELAALTKDLNALYPDTPRRVTGRISELLEAKYHQQVAFWSNAQQALDGAITFEVFEGPSGPIKLAIARSDNPEASKFARSEAGGGADIVIQHQTRGNTQVFINRKSGKGIISLRDLARMVRIEEQKLKGSFLVRDWNLLAVEGKIEGAEEWYYHPEGEMLLNGSLTAPNVPATKISLERLIELTRIAFSGDFELSRAAICRQGRCNSTFQNPCPWFDWGMDRCRRLREATKNRLLGRTPTMLKQGKRR